MASCDWQKIKTSQEVRAKLRHCVTDERVKMKHGNKQIDTSLTHTNMTFGAMSDLDEAMTKYAERIEELDAVKGANKRKDRVTCLGLVVPTPEGMPDAVARDWFADVYAHMVDRFGAENVIGGSVHFDEIHEYINAETKQKSVSRAHLHVYAVPETNGKLNAKSVMSKAGMASMNREIEELTRSRYPGYVFVNGKGTKSRGSVESLKYQSMVLDAEAKAKEEAQHLIDDAQRRSERVLSDANDKAEEIIKGADEEASRRRLSASQMRRASMVALSSAESLMKEAQAVLDEVKTLEEAQKAPSGSKLERALEFMDGIRFSDGTTARKRFESKELVFGHKMRPTRSRAELERVTNDLFNRMNRQRGGDGNGLDY